ncbi:SWIM zinc finger family protein [Halorubrum sp. AD140]|uniref:SWIM zinc finger family protein n=1 Tax=Halorubrum sp. AD140 TaxID=3050073 RepID=UPI002ACCB3D6|nr:SWIM zinc finger family protein [Halorubrum sp. AD140]MDZ5810368.1 SWIM zinc finger family protein [Halorubrum sp. AD140]
MTVIEEAQSLFSVTTQSGSEYTVDLREPACTCPDFEHRSEQLGEQGCKHIRRVRIEVGQVDVDALEESLSEQADDIQRDAEELKQVADELGETATELEDAVARLREVAER